MLRFLDAGESHGKALTAIIDGFPANVEIDIDAINNHLKRRQSGYGRGNRMKIEKDKVEIISGVRGGKTTGGPICLTIYNDDYSNWENIMDLKKEYGDKVSIPRPGHADLNGALKYNLDDIRNVIERASARETAIRVAVGGICMELLKNFGVKIVSRVIQIGKIKDSSSFNLDSPKEYEIIEGSPVRCLDKEAEEKMIKEIDSTREIGDSLGGAIKVSAINVPVGLGSYAQYDLRIDGVLAGALMSIQGVKGIEIGEGIDLSSSYGSMANDEISIDCGKYKRFTNHAGGVEGGITNGMPVEATVYMKPIPTIKKTLRTVDLWGVERLNRYERSDVCVIPALGVVCEHVLAFVIAKFFLEKFSGDSIEDITNSYNSYYTRLVRG